VIIQPLAEKSVRSREISAFAAPPTAPLRGTVACVAESQHNR
jgi:hypothetical protein